MGGGQEQGVEDTSKLVDGQRDQACRGGCGVAFDRGGHRQEGVGEHGQGGPAVPGALKDARVRDTLYALAVGENAGQAEELWATLSRTLPDPWRVEALVLLAFSAYVRGDGPLAGVSLDAALRCDPTHRMAGMLDTALQSGMRPERIRELAVTGYRLADQLGVRLPPKRAFGRRAG